MVEKVRRINKRRVFIPERYLSMSQLSAVMDFPNLGVGRIYPHSEFNKLLDSGLVDRRVVVNFEFRILEK